MHLSDAPQPDFSLEGFTPILPFGDENPLEETVQSDHAEIAIKLANGDVVSAWNISNPIFHNYFKLGGLPPFHKTHLFIENPFVENRIHTALKAKCDLQIQNLAERFVRKEVGIQVVVEGFESFYQQLEAEIRTLGFEYFQIVSLLDDMPTSWRRGDNIVGILINTSRYELLSRKVIHKDYCEVEDGNKAKTMYLPYVHVRDKMTNLTFAIVGVHINGCESQYPKSGLEVLGNQIKELHTTLEGKPDVLALGDFNTTPSQTALCMTPLLDNEWKVIFPLYLTHVNPKSQAASYDHAIILGSTLKCSFLTEERILESSQALVRSIKRAIARR
jgi:hypothetical protein